MSVRKPATLAIVLAGVGAPLAAQQKVSLTRPDAAFEEPFTQVSSVRELPNGKLLVADPRDKIVQLVDLAAGTALKIGREGQGPAEYAMPMTLFPMPDGTTLLQDLLNRRYLVLGADGSPTGNPISMPDLTAVGPQAGRAGGVRIGISMAQGVDGQGRLYFQPPSFTSDGATPDSAAIVRWQPAPNAETAEPKTETVGYVRLARGSQSATARGGNVRVMIGGGRIFAPQEAWGVDAAGRIARVTPEPYQVHWLADGKVTSGPMVPYRPLKVTEADKQAVLEARRRNPPTMIMRTEGGGGSRSAAPPAVQMPEPEFEATKPPFWGGGGGLSAGAAVLVAPEGEVWVQRTRAATDHVPRYDVFDRNGVLARQVTLNPRSRVVGFGKGTVYVIRSDEDDLQYLERYRR